MWGDQETAPAMEFYYSERNTEPKLIDFFKCEMPLREVHGGSSREQTYVYRPGNQQLGSGGYGAWKESPAIADGGRSLKLEPPSGSFVDFLSGNGDFHSNHQLVASRSSSAGGKHAMALKSIQEAVTGDHWSSVMAPSLPNLALKLLSPSPTGTQASGTSPPKTPTFDMELNSHTRPQPSVTTMEGESSTVSADSDRRLVASFLPDHVADRKLHKKKPDSRVYRWSPKNGPKRLKIRAESEDDDDDAAMVEEKMQSRTRDGSTTCRKLREKDDEESEAVAQAAASLLTLSSNDDDWQPTSSTPPPFRRRNVSSASSLAAIGEGGSERESGADGSIVGCSGSVLSRPINKRRYRSVVDLLAESPRVR